MGSDKEKKEKDKHKKDKKDKHKEHRDKKDKHDKKSKRSSTHSKTEEESPSKPVKMDEDEDPEFAVRVISAPRNTETFQKVANLERKIEAIAQSQPHQDPGALSLLDDEESDVSEDDDAELAVPIADEFMTVMHKLTSHDPEIYQPGRNYFPDEIEVEEKEKKERKVTLKDLEREAVLARVAAGDDGDFSDEEEQKQLSAMEKKTKTMTYAQEQELAKKEMLAAAWAVDDDVAPADVDEAGLVKKIRTEQQEEEFETDYKEFLKRQEAQLAEEAKKRKTSKASEAAPDSEQPAERQFNPLRSFWTRSDLSDKDQFLRNYVLNMGWTSKGGEAPVMLDEDEDEEALDKQDKFEAVYNFRYEDPSGTTIITHAREQPDSVRVKASKRAEKRARKKERERIESVAAQEAKIEAKKSKRAEIVDYVKQLAEAAGLKDGMKEFDKDDGDWDPDAHDKQMDATFGDQYYEQEEVERPEFAVDDLGIENVEEWLEKVKSMKKGGSKDNDDAAHKAVELEKALDEYYQLDFEGLAGDQQTRFKYIEVPANNYGLTNEELLNMSDTELNELIPATILAPYREDAGKSLKKKNVLWKKKQMMMKLRAERKAAKSQGSTGDKKHSDSYKSGFKKNSHESTDKSDHHQFKSKSKNHSAEGSHHDSAMDVDHADRKHDKKSAFAGAESPQAPKNHKKRQREENLESSETVLPTVYKKKKTQESE